MKVKRDLISSILLFSLIQVLALGTPFYAVKLLNLLLPKAFTTIPFSIISVVTLAFTITGFIFLCKHFNKQFNQNINYGEYFTTGITVSIISPFIIVFGFAFVPDTFIYPITRTWSRFIVNAKEALFVFGIFSVGLVIEFVIIILFYEKFYQSKI